MTKLKETKNNPPPYTAPRTWSALKCCGSVIFPDEIINQTPLTSKKKKKVTHSEMKRDDAEQQSIKEVK